MRLVVEESELRASPGGPAGMQSKAEPALRPDAVVTAPFASGDGTTSHDPRLPTWRVRSRTRLWWRENVTSWRRPSFHHEAPSFLGYASTR